MNIEELATAEEVKLEPQYATLLSKYEDILTVDEVAKILRVDKKCVYKLVHSNELKSIQLDRSIRIAKIWLLEYLQLHGHKQEKNARVRRQKETLEFCATPRSRAELQRHFGLTDKIHFMRTVLTPLLDQGKLCRTIPEVPNHLKQKYVTASK